jgi:hypothetical protein
VRTLARAAARAYLDQREKLGYPLLRPLSERRYGRAALAAADGAALAQDPIALRT